MTSYPSIYDQGPAPWLEPMSKIMIANGFAFRKQPNLTSIGGLWEVEKDGKVYLIAPRTCAKRVMNARFKNGRWTTLSEADFVAIICDCRKSNTLEFRLVPAEEVIARFDRLRLAKAKAGHKANESFALHLDRKDDVRWATYAGSGLADDYPALETAAAAIVPAVAARSTVPEASSYLKVWIETARHEVASLIGIPSTQVGIRIEILG